MASSFAARTLQLLYSSALGAILQLLLSSLCSATEKLVGLESNLSRLESTLESIDHAFPNEALSSRRRLSIEEAHELIRRGSRVRRWNAFEMWYYSTKINESQASLDRFILNHVVVLGFQKTERTSEVVINLEDKVNTVIEMASDIATMTRRQIFTSKQQVPSDKSFAENVASASGTLSGR